MDAARRHEALVARLRESEAVSDRVLDAFARVPRHHFLPGVAAKVAYRDDAIVTHDEGGVPTSSSSQPSLMARMLEQLELRAGDRVLEIGTGTGYNAALMAELGAAVTSVELQPEVAAAARAHLRALGIPTSGDATPGDALEERAGDRDATPGDAPAEHDPPPLAPGSVRVITGDGAAPPDGPYERIIVTAGCWSLPAAVVDALADGGVLVAPLRVNGVELVLALRRAGDVLSGGGAIPCGFMPLRGGDERPWRWELGGGGAATADADLGVEGRGALDRLLAEPGRPVGDPLALREGEHALGAILWLGLQGDPLVTLMRPGKAGRSPWTVGLHVLPASLLVLELAGGYRALAGAWLHGGEAALRTCLAGMETWRTAGSPGPAALRLTVERHSDRTGWSLPFATADGAATMVRGAHRWTLRYVNP
jgi:protein-L-isoaspartate(D-aspartate) O-methyltransferase